MSRGSSDSRKPDPLLEIEPARYVRALTGANPQRHGKIHCPFHPDNTPSLHVYHSPERGWTCFGCTRADGRPLGGDIYTLASLLWGIPATGRGFLRAASPARHPVRCVPYRISR